MLSRRVAVTTVRALAAMVWLGGVIDAVDALERGAGWQHAGSIVADPRFTDPAHDDFALAAVAPAARR